MYQMPNYPFNFPNQSLPETNPHLEQHAMLKDPSNSEDVEG